LGLEGVEQRKGDASSLESLLTVASSAKVIYNCANPTYNTWKVEWPKISSSVSEFAMRTEADLVICSNLYGYGPHEGVLTEDFPLKATWVNGVARAKVWQENKALNDAGKLRVTEVRGSDYICANEQSRMGDRVVPNLIAGKPIQLLGAIDQPHTWTDPDDVAKLMITLAEDDRSWGRPWHVPSNEPKTQREVVADIANELGVTDYKVAPVGILLENILGVFNPVIRELNRGRYQFTKTYVVGSKAAQDTFGLSPKPWGQVIRDLVKTYKNR
jgi:nucleoside-diphosphate-sugar epimerase